MVIGIPLLSLLTATLAAFLVEQEKEGATLDDVLAKLEEQIEELKSRE